MTLADVAVVAALTTAGLLLGIGVATRHTGRGRVLKSLGAVASTVVVLLVVRFLVPDALSAGLYLAFVLGLGARAAAEVVIARPRAHRV